ncbi:uncharacterized protein J4E84_002249 [Alternaria hordeiaustralica]|uniref:uncharacterized protein n=1 Tax=Alternaria hordeiaustralica TaxID=1187925 RepID=UPI0020C35D0E|nr:uncharacterized protein J4E84_002249 [Alternaria hordeiaustralica]KAI4693675.1 hypothetical protein J4E84_002249 [Alternaria hordeiaustralica]
MLIMPDLEGRMEEMPEDLYKEIAREVDRMIGTYLTASEGETTFRMAKRKLLDDYEAFEREREAERRVRRRVDDAAAGDVPEITVQSSSSTGQSEGSLIHEEETQQDDELEMYMLGYNPTASHSSPVRERPSPTAPDIDLNFSDFRIPSSEQSRGSRGSPSSLGFLNNYSSSPPARPSNPTPRRGRGGPYSSDDTPSPQRLGPVDLSSEDVPSGEDEQPILRPSNPTPRRAQGSIGVQVDTPRPKTARGNRAGLNQGSHVTHISAVFPEDHSPVHEAPQPRITGRDIRERREKERASNAVKTARKPRNTIPLEQPPSAMAVRTRGEVPGHWLPSIREGLSPHVSPAEGTKQYRVAESRKLNKLLQGERAERRNFRKYIPPIGEEPHGHEEEPLAEAAEARRQEVLPESSRSEIPSRFASIDPEVAQDDDIVHVEGATESSSSTGAIMTASPAVRHDNPLPAAAVQSSSPRSKSLPQPATKGQSRRSAAPSPPERPTPKLAKTSAAKALAKTPAETPAKQKAPPTTGTRKSGRIAKLKGEKK